MNGQTSLNWVAGLNQTFTAHSGKNYVGMVEDTDSGSKWQLYGFKEDRLAPSRKIAMKQLQEVWQNQTLGE